MTARLAIGEDARERLRRLSIVFAVELRLKIVAELYMREMSAKQFYEEFGGGTAARVSQNFKTLEREDWLRYIRSEGPGGGRRGGIEHFYRSVEPPFFDAETWGLLPYSIRVASSWNIIRRVAPRLRSDLEASIGKEGRPRDLTCREFLLDEEGWTRSIEAVTAHFVRVFDEQENSGHRVRHSGEELVRTDVFSFAFEPAAQRVSEASLRLSEHPVEPLVSLPERLAPILRDEVRMRIVSELNRREMSVTEFYREFGGASKSAIGRRFKALERDGWEAKGKARSGGKRRGAVEQFYCATKPAVPSDLDSCTNRPRPSLMYGGSWRMFEVLCETIVESMLAGTFDIRPARCINWSFVNLDQQGREAVIHATDTLEQLICEEEEHAGRRLAKSFETPVPMTLGLAVLAASKEPGKAS